MVVIVSSSALSSSTLPHVVDRSILSGPYHSPTSLGGLNLHWMDGSFFYVNPKWKWCRISLFQWSDLWIVQLLSFTTHIHVPFISDFPLFPQYTLARNHSLSFACCIALPERPRQAPPSRRRNQFIILEFIRYGGTFYYSPPPTR